MEITEIIFITLISAFATGWYFPTRDESFRQKAVGEREIQKISLYFIPSIRQDGKFLIGRGALHVEIRGKQNSSTWNSAKEFIFSSKYGTLLSCQQFKMSLCILRSVSHLLCTISWNLTLFLEITYCFRNKVRQNIIFYHSSFCGLILILELQKKIETGTKEILTDSNIILMLKKTDINHTKSSEGKFWDFCLFT